MPLQPTTHVSAPCPVCNVGTLGLHDVYQVRFQAICGIEFEPVQINNYIASYKQSYKLLLILARFAISRSVSYIVNSSMSTYLQFNAHISIA